jgi:hypothetical protein
MNSTAPSEYIVQLRLITQRVLFYSGIFVAFPGLILNTVNFIVYFKGNFTKSMRFFYSLQSIVDILNIVIWLLVTFLPSLGIDISLQSDFLCKFLFTWRRVMAQSSSWLQVMISVDRLFSTFFSAKYRQVLGAKYLIGSVALIELVIVSTSMINLSFFLNIAVSTVNNQTVIQRTCAPRPGFGFIVNVSGFSIRVVLSFLCMLVANLVLVNKLFIHKSMMNKLSNKEYNFAFALVSNNFAYLLFNLPFSVQQLIEYLPVFNTAEDRAFWNFVSVIGTICIIFYWSYTFLIYLKCNNTFKKELFRMKRRIFNDSVSSSLIATTVRPSNNNTL